MRLTITRKLALGMALILILGTASMLVIYQGLFKVKESMDRLLTAKEPVSAAAHEMEIQIHAITSDVLGYLNSPDPERRDELTSHYAKFAAFLESYRDLAEAAEVRDLANELEHGYVAFRALGDALMARRDEQEGYLIKAFRNFERIDRIVDAEIEPRLRLDPARASALVQRKFEALAAFEGEIAGVMLSLANYRRVHKPKHEERLVAHQRQARLQLTALEGLAGGDEKPWLRSIEQLLGETVALTADALALEGRHRADLQKLTSLEHEIDRLLDERIQIAAREDLIAPSRAADLATSEVIRRIGVLVPLFVLSACAVMLGLVRVISAPIKELMAGTRAVARGGLSYRIRPKGSDELAQLAHEFNRMVDELESTTVSKTALEASEQKLKELVVELRQQVLERMHAEQEQARLHASLRQAETMSAMGSLVAGVAHQVRNPLFGISSVLDAMEARFGQLEAYEKYITVLRREVTRLAELTQELFEYGKPAGLQLSPGSIGDVIRDAASVRARLADELGVRIVLPREVRVGNLLMDRTRLMRVFENLIENAMQHSPPGGEVVVEVRQADGAEAVECVVKDSGPGIAAEDLPHVLEPFFTRRRGGIGMGLSIVERIVEQHGGTVIVGNRPEGGAAITVRLPLARSQANAA